MFDKIFQAFFKEISRFVRDEVDYMAGKIRTDIETGITEAFDAIRKYTFFLLIAIGSTLVGLIFVTWGLAKLVGEIIDSVGGGYLVFGTLLMLVGVTSLSLSRPRAKRT